MRTPTQAQWATVIEKLYSVLPFALREGSLNMMEVCVNQHGYSCGTTHCVGGWYAIATWQEKALNGAVPLSYRNGADAMANDLGFECAPGLRSWASENKLIWGNYKGEEMFAQSGAYNHGEGPAKNLADVIRHFEFVADNCKKVRG